jgi:oxygen-dependent protoporphyrinogen oxidase
MEDRHGGLVRALIAKRLAERGRGDGAGPAGPGGRLTSFRAGGMQRLIDALAATPGVRIRTGARAEAVAAESTGGFRVHVAGGESVAADALIVAVPAPVAARLLADLAPEARSELAAIPYAGARVVAVGYERGDVPHDLAGFGFLVPPGQGLRMLGCQWSSSLFPDQAPPGGVLLRVIGGGVSDPAFVDMPDSAALALVREELRATLGIEAPPVFVHQVRWDRAIPQYTVGHLERVARIVAATGMRRGLFLTGNAYEGVGIDACVGHAQRVGTAAAELVAAQARA